VYLRAAAKTVAIEEQQDIMEEHAVASAMQGFHSAPEPDRKPSAEEEEAGTRAELTGRIEEMERPKEAAVAEEDYLTAAEIKRDIAELVEQREALERAVTEEDTKKPAAAQPDSEARACRSAVYAWKHPRPWLNYGSDQIISCGHTYICESA